MGDDSPQLRQRIAATLEMVSAELGGRFIQDVRVGEAVAGTRLDFVFVDAYGCLVLRVEQWEGARLQGTSEGVSWSASTDAGSVALPNPFLALKGQIASMIVHVGLALPEPGVRHVADLVVVEAADTSRLILDDAHRFKLVDVTGLADALRARHDFAINAGVYSPEQIGMVADVIAGMAATDAEDVAPEPSAPVTGPAAADDSASQQVADGSSVLPGYTASPEPEVTGPSTAVGTPWNPVGDPGEPPSPFRHDGWDDMPAVAPPRAVAFTGYPSDPVERKHKIRLDASLLTAVVLAGFAVWLVYYGGLSKVVGATTGAVTGIQQRYSDQVSTSSDTVEAGHSVAEAKAAIKAQEPKVYTSLIDPDTPEVVKRGEYVVYEWRYGAPAVPSGTEKSVTVTFDSNGLLRGVEAAR